MTVSDYVIKAMVASVANWSRTDIVLKEAFLGRFRNSPVGSHGSQWSGASA